MYIMRSNPALALRLSMSDYRKTDWLVNVQLYAIRRIGSLINETT